MTKFIETLNPHAISNEVLSTILVEKLDVSTEHDLPAQRKFSLPKDLDRTEIVTSDLPPHYIPSAIVLLATIKSITDHKNYYDRRCENNAFARLSNRSIRASLSNLSGNSPKLLKAMANAGWIEIDHSYKVYKMSKGYRIGPRFAQSGWIEMEWKSALHLHLPEILEKTAIAKKRVVLYAMWNRACEYRYLSEKTGDEVLEKISERTREILKKLKISDSDGLKAKMNECLKELIERADKRKKPDEAMKAWQRANDEIENGKPKVSCPSKIKRNGTERLYTNWTNLKSDFRPYFHLEGRPLVSIDIKACQPALLAALYDNDDPEDSCEKAKYIDIAQNGDFYEYLATSCQQAFPKMQFSRERAKKTMFTIIFGPTWRQNRKLYGVFKGLFPVLVRRIEACKKPKHNAVACLTQLKESKIMIRGVLNELLFEKNITCLSIHDSISCFVEDMETVKATIGRWFEREMGFTPQFKEDSSSIIKTEPVTPTALSIKLAKFPQGRIEIRVFEHEVEICRLWGRICNTNAEVAVALLGCFSEDDWNDYFQRYYRANILSFPCAVLSSITTNVDRQNSGFGTIGLKAFDELAIENGCAVALLQVGGNTPEDMKKLVAMYSDRGWQCLIESDLEGDSGKWDMNMYKELPAHCPKDPLNKVPTSYQRSQKVYRLPPIGASTKLSWDSGRQAHLKQNSLEQICIGGGNQVGL